MTSLATKKEVARCCIAGGGPAGMMLGFLLARAGVEVGAAVVIIAFGALLLTGYMVTERMVGI